MDMSEMNIINTLKYAERVGTYAEIYFDDDYCDYKPPAKEPANSKAAHDTKPRDEWVSPSDMLIGKLDLTPPFTSKIARGTAHKGLLEIGDAVLQKERDKFLKNLAELLSDNDSAWIHIQEQEKIVVAQKVKAIYERIFARKSDTMQKEISMFYEDTLREMEKHLRTEVRSVLMSAHCSMISDLNTQITEKLKKEKQILEQVLRKKYNGEIKKLNRYYSLLLQNEEHRSNKLVNDTLRERNDALKMFCKQIETDSATSTMYVMCTERKKCRMRQFLLKNYHTKEIEDKLRSIKEKQEIIDEFQRGKKQIFDINKEWEEKVKKILQLFLKFISFCLKLLPEQTTFLLDLEKLVVLQLNEIKKYPEQTPNILLNKNDFENLFEFHKPSEEESVCEGDPFVIEGDLEPSIPTPYGSRETLPTHADLPYFRLQRQFIYAKCQKIDQVREYLDSLRCKCRDFPTREPSNAGIASASTTPEPTPSPQVTPKSSEELFMVDDFDRLQHCPLRGCHSLANRLTFPNLDDYLDFDEEKYLRVETILGKPAKLEEPPKMLDPKEIIRRDLVFSATTEPCHTVETQYSSQEDLPQVDVTCPCMSVNAHEKQLGTSSPKKIVDYCNLLQMRKESLKRLVHENPKLLKLFSEESFDFVY